MGSNVETLHPPSQPLEGCLDAVSEGKVFGWVWDRERPQDRMAVELWQGEATVATGVADLRRADLAGSGMGDGAYAFEIALPEGCDAEALVVRARSPSTSKVTILALRPTPQMDDLPSDLQRLQASMHGLALVQKQTVNAVHVVVRELRDASGEGRLAAIERRLAELATGQQALGKQLESAEVFLMRFDGLLRQLDAKLAARPALRNSAAVKAVAVLCVAFGAVAAITYLAL